MSNPKSQYSPLDAKVESMEPLQNEDARWIRMKKIVYKDAAGKTRSWEMAERQTRPKDTICDGIGVIAILRDPKAGPSLLLQKQFRPPLNKVTIEVPSGLIDKGETPAESALRELKEETGYIATIPDDERKDAGFIMWNDPGFCNTNTKMIFVNVDLNDPRNQDPKPELEDSEYIDCFSLPLATLWESLTKLDEEGFAIDARVATLAQGMVMAKKWKEIVLQ